MGKDIEGISAVEPREYRSRFIDKLCTPHRGHFQGIKPRSQDEPSRLSNSAIRQLSETLALNDKGQTALSQALEGVTEERWYT
jgi:hypothetical protein